MTQEEILLTKSLGALVYKKLKPKGSNFTPKKKKRKKK